MKKYIILTLLVALVTTLTGCKDRAYEEPANSLRSKVGSAFGLTIEMKNKERTPIDFQEEKLSQELEEYIRANVPGFEENRYLIQLEDTIGVRWIDFKKKKTKVYYPPLDETYTHIGSTLNSPNGRYIALNLTQGFLSPWSKLLIIDTKENHYTIPLTDEVLLEPAEGSSCTSVEIIEIRDETNKNNECVIEAPGSAYLIDYWSTDHTVELIKNFPSGTILYSLDVE